MPARGDLAGLAAVAAGAAGEGATATESVAACICRVVRRQLAMDHCLRAGHGSRPASSCVMLHFRAEPPPFRPERAAFGCRTQSTAKSAVPRSNWRQPLPNSPAPATKAGNHENLNKSKGPDKCPGLLVNPVEFGNPWYNRDGLLVLFGLLFRGCKALEALQKFLLGHALNRDLGVIGIDAGACRPDQGHRIGLRLVNLDEFLQ